MGPLAWWNRLRVRSFKAVTLGTFVVALVLLALGSYLHQAKGLI